MFTIKRIYSGYVRPYEDDLWLVRNEDDLKVRLFPQGFGLFGRLRDDLGYEYYDEYSPDFWGYKTEARVQMYAYFTNTKCSLEEAQESLLSRMYGGTFKLDIENLGYSDWTITGYNIETCTLGGHNLYDEFKTHIGQYMYLIVDDLKEE